MLKVNSISNVNATEASLFGKKKSKPVSFEGNPEGVKKSPAKKIALVALIGAAIAGVVVLVKKGKAKEALEFVKSKLPKAAEKGKEVAEEAVEGAQKLFA